MSLYKGSRNRMISTGASLNGSRELDQGDISFDEDMTYSEGENIERQTLLVSCRLKYFQAAMFATILEDTIIELRILGECNNELRIIKTLTDMELLRAFKYQVTQPEVKDELDGVDPHQLGCMRYKLDKLAADRKYMGDVLMETYLDLSLTRSYNALVERISDIDKIDAHRAFLVEDEAKNKITRRELMKQLRQQRNHCKSVTYDTDLIIDQLKSQVEDATLNAEVQSRYINNWQRARTEQHHQSIYEKEAGPSHAIKCCRQRSDHEQRVHSEVEMLTNIKINETLQKVESWMNKYDKDMEEIDLKIQIKKNEYQNTYDKRIGMEIMYEKHDKLMKDWVHFKEEREKARLYREKMTNSAITVQAWWRGLLVRLQLGPFKVVKKRGAPPAGGKKKK